VRAPPYSGNSAMPAAADRSRPEWRRRTMRLPAPQIVRQQTTEPHRAGLRQTSVKRQTNESTTLGLKTDRGDER
jgi:hypothetical protein